jgi:hypothetical protein
MDPAGQGFGHLGIDLAAKAGQAAERGLDVAAGAAEPVVQVEVPERGIEIVAPHQADHAAAEPDAFRVAGRAVDRLGGFDEFVGLALAVLDGIGRGGGRRFARLVLGAAVAALGQRGSGTDQKCKRGDGEVAQNRILKLKHTATHEFPDLLPSEASSDAARLMPSKWVPNTAETAPDSMTDISDFVQQSHNFIASW